MNILIGLIVVALSAQFWRMGGDGQSLWRNPIVPITLAVAKCYLLGWNLWALTYILALYGVIQLFSYGETAPITKLWSKLFGTSKLTEVLTRSTCGLLWSLSGIVFAILTGHWIALGLYVLFLTVSCGTVYLTIKDVEINERLVGACVSTSILI